MPSKAFPNHYPILTRATGHICVTVLRVLRWVPADFSYATLKIFLPLYRILRPRQTTRLKKLLQTLSVSLKNYDEMRLQLILHNLRVHGRSVDLSKVKLTGEENYLNALTQDRPILLLGLHQGVLEYLHKIPAKPVDRPFCILTAPAFAVSLGQYMAAGRSLDGKQVIWDRNIGVTYANQTPAKEAVSLPLSFSNGLREILKHKGILAMMADQLRTDSAEFFTHPENKNKIQLFGKLEIPSSIPFLEYLIEKEFVVIPVSTFLSEDGISHFTFKPAWDLTKIRNNENAESLIREELKSFLEAAILEAPEQWNWSYPKNRLVNNS